MRLVAPALVLSLFSIHPVCSAPSHRKPISRTPDNATSTASADSKASPSSSSVVLSLRSSTPSSAVSVAPDLIGFSIEQDRWPEWGGSSAFWLNTLKNLQTLSGAPARIRIGADSEDHTDFSPSESILQATFPAQTTYMPYPEAKHLIVGQGFYNLASNLLPGTKVIWGVNFGGANLTATYLETVAICNAFNSPAFKKNGITLEAIEIGNEADMFRWNGLRDLNYSMKDYVPEWTRFAQNVSRTANKLMGRKVPLQGMAFALSNYDWSPASAIKMGILDSDAGKQITQVSQHRYSGSFCTGSPALLQSLMTKSAIRGNLTALKLDIDATHAHGLRYVLGETNSLACHGAPGVSDTAAAALWALDYALYASLLGIEHLYFHQGVGYKYNFVQPIELTRSIDDGHMLSSPLPAHIQPAYYASIIVAEILGDLDSPKIVELDTGDADQVSAYAFYDHGKLARALLINLRAYMGGSRMPAHFLFSGADTKAAVTVKRLYVPQANAISGLTWGGQTYETDDGTVDGKLDVMHTTLTGGIDVHDTEVVLLIF